MELRDALSQHISTLPGHLVKDVLLRWAETSDFSVVALDEALQEQQASLETHLNGSSPHDGLHGEQDETVTLAPLSEQQMVAHSKAALANYRETGHAIPHGRMKSWAASLGTAQEQSCPH